jgi:hypothetical protein
VLWTKRFRKIPCTFFVDTLMGDMTMQPRPASAAFVQVPSRSERQMEIAIGDEPGTLPADAIPVQRHGPSHEGSVGCQIDLLEEFLDALLHVPNVTIARKQ